MNIIGTLLKYYRKITIVTDTGEVNEVSLGEVNNLIIYKYLV